MRRFISCQAIPIYDNLRSIDNSLSFRDHVVCRASDDSIDWETRGGVVSAVAAIVHLVALAADAAPPTADLPDPAAAPAAAAAAGDDAVEGYANLP